MSREKFEFLAEEILSKKRQVVEKSKSMKIGLRELLSSSKYLKILTKAGVRIQLSEVKGVLKHLNFNFNGASCSLTQFLDKL